MLVKKRAHRVDERAAFEEYFAYLRIDDQVDITLAVTKFRIAEGVVYLPVLFFDDRQRVQRFAQYREFFAMHRQFSGLRNEGESPDADDVADIEQFFENLVVQRGFGIAVADVIAFDVHLNPAGVVLQFEKRGASHDPPRHDPSGNRNLLEISFVGIVLRSDPRGGRRHFVFGRRVRLYAQFTQFGQRVAPDLFLFAKFRDAHRVWIDCKSP